MTTERRVVRLKVRLDGVEPRVERWLVVPVKIGLDRLHLTLQAAMGWTDSHLWEIRAGDCGWSIPNPMASTTDQPLDARKATLQHVIADTGVKRLTYDFGDGWGHTVKLDKFTALLSEIEVPFLVEAWGCCPPEDCGGPAGYAELIDALADPAHKDHATALDQLRAGYDPEVAPFELLRDRVDQLAGLWAPKPRK